MDNPYSRKFTDGIKKEFVSGMLKELKLPSDNIKINYILDYYASASIALVSKWM
ncbi:MAG: hypothetical protein ACOX7J_02255 [Bacillota bacterium]